MTTLREVKNTQPEWFSRKNKKFFGDIEYRVLHSKITGDPYLARKTNAWTDMFDGVKKPHWRLNHIHPFSLKIESLVDKIFPDLWAVERWLKEN